MLNKRWGVLLKNVVRPEFKRAVKLVLWTAVFVFAAVRIVSQQIKINDFKGRIATLEESVTQLGERKAELEAQSDLYSSDEYIEEAARMRLGYVRSDEVIFRRAAD